MMRRSGVALSNFGRRKDKIREAMSRATTQQTNFAGENFIGDEGRSEGEPNRKLKLPRGESRARSETSVKRGAEVAEKAKTLADGEWEAVPLAEKHDFVKWASRMLKKQPSVMTEQLRRRYYEQTGADPTAIDPNETITDHTERIRHGLPIHLRNTRRQLGVSDAIHETGEAALFDPANAYRLENAMIHVKQLFKDYTAKKKQGISTIEERRQLANVSADLNFETQKHLAHMFRFAGERIRDTVKDERRRQLEHIAAVKRAVETNKKPGKGFRLKKKRVLAKLRDSFGLDVEVAEELWQQLRLQQEFLATCEVMCRMTLGRGFTHTREDEPLDEYVSALKDVYSGDPSRLAKLDFVRFTAAADGGSDVAPTDWAARWFQKALLLPLQKTPEYQELERLRTEHEEAAIKAVEVQQEADAAEPTLQLEGKQDSAAAKGTNEDDRLSAEAISAAASMRQKKAVNIVDRMFVHPNDEALESIHERRLRYVAYLHMESQITKMRRNAELFEDASQAPEAAEVMKRYEALQKRKAELEANNPDTNAFVDSEVTEHFQAMQSLVKQYIKRTKRLAAPKKAATRLRDIAAAVKSSSPAAVAAEHHRAVKQRRRELSLRLLRLMERDVREDIELVENMEEAERPALLPVPEPMAYVSAADVAAWTDLRKQEADEKGNPFLGPSSKKQRPGGFSASLLGQPWEIPDKPIIFWGTGHAAVKQALRHAAEDAERRRNGQELAPPYPCPENPWGWRLSQDVLDDDFGAASKPTE